MKGIPFMITRGLMMSGCRCRRKRSWKVASPLHAKLAEQFVCVSFSNEGFVRFQRLLVCYVVCRLPELSRCQASSLLWTSNAASRGSFFPTVSSKWIQCADILLPCSRSNTQTSLHGARRRPRPCLTQRTSCPPHPQIPTGTNPSCRRALCPS